METKSTMTQCHATDKVTLDQATSKLTHGYTTGSAAAAAAKAATLMLLTGKEKKNIQIITPQGTSYEAEIVDISMTPDKVTCAVVKDGGSDPDTTTGAHITATVSLYDEAGVFIDGGEGVGRVTKPGLDQPVGMAAINRVPRDMIASAVEDVCEAYDYEGGIQVLITVPGGEDIAARTLNSKLGITGGISILGTSGIVEPMSTKAIVETMRVEMRQQKALGHNDVITVPGNYGQGFLKENYGIEAAELVQCSNFIGDAVDIAAELGFDRLLIVGHIGKLVKVSGGIMNTHSREGDCRQELFTAAALRAGCTLETARALLDAATTEECVRIVKEQAILEGTMAEIMTRIMENLRRRAAGRIEIALIVYSMNDGLLAQSDNVSQILEAYTPGSARCRS